MKSAARGPMITPPRRNRSRINVRRQQKRGLSRTSIDVDHRMFLAAQRHCSRTQHEVQPLSLTMESRARELRRDRDWPERLITDPRSVGSTKTARHFMPIDSWLDARRIPPRIGPAGAQTADMRRLPLIAAACRQRRPAAVRLDSCDAVVTSHQAATGSSAISSGLAALALPQQISACLFDLDGVLTDTARVHAAAWKEMFDCLPAGPGRARARTIRRVRPGRGPRRLCGRQTARGWHPSVSGLTWDRPPRGTSGGSAGRADGAGPGEPQERDRATPDPPPTGCRRIRGRSPTCGPCGTRGCAGRWCRRAPTAVTS